MRFKKLHLTCTPWVHTDLIVNGAIYWNDLEEGQDPETTVYLTMGPFVKPIPPVGNRKAYKTILLAFIKEDKSRIVWYLTKLMQVTSIINETPQTLRRMETILQGRPGINNRDNAKSKSKYFRLVLFQVVFRTRRFPPLVLSIYSYPKS